MNTKMMMVTAVVVMLAGAAQADFVLSGTQHKDVTTSHDTGILYDTSTADVLAGGQISNAYVNDEAWLNILEGSGSYTSVLSLYAYDTAGVAISGGDVVLLYAYNSSVVAMSGGDVSRIYAYNNSGVDIDGGNVSYSLEAHDASTMDIADGGVYRLYAYDTSTMDISGGSFFVLDTYNASTVNFSGGSLDILYAHSNSAITFNGYDFRATGGLTLDGNRVLGTGVLSGRWFGDDDTMWITTINGNDSGATIMVVPEPCTGLLLIGGLLLSRRRRAKT